MLELGECGALRDLSLSGTFEEALDDFLVDAEIGLHVLDLLHRLLRLLTIVSDL